MMAFPSMIAETARQAGMKVPPNEGEDDFSPDEFPHFHVYCNVQLGVALTWGNHWENAKIIASIPEDKLRSITVQDLEVMGFDP